MKTWKRLICPERSKTLLKARINYPAHLIWLKTRKILGIDKLLVKVEILWIRTLLTLFLIERSRFCNHDTSNKNRAARSLLCRLECKCLRAEHWNDSDPRVGPWVFLPSLLYSFNLFHTTRLQGQEPRCWPQMFFVSASRAVGTVPNHADHSVRLCACGRQPVSRRLWHLCLITNPRGYTKLQVTRAWKACGRSWKWRAGVPEPSQPVRVDDGSWPFWPSAGTLKFCRYIFSRNTRTGPDLSIMVSCVLASWIPLISGPSCRPATSEWMAYPES